MILILQSNQIKMSEILYHDNQITIYKELIVINKYFFPLATSKTILFSDIATVGIISTDGVTHRWGICGKYLNNWFPYDSDRKNKKKFIEIVLKGRKTRPSITPEDPDKVFQIIWEHHTSEGKDYAEKMSEKVGKETEIAQQQLMQRGIETSQQVLEMKNMEKVSAD